MYDIPHGLICGSLMASANEINVQELRRTAVNPAAFKKYIILSELFLDEKGKTDDYLIDGFIQFLYDLTDELNLPGFKKYGIEEKDLELICRNTEIKNNPVNLDVEVLVQILNKRL
jgi:alcohol dehydrogenase class IV